MPAADDSGCVSPHDTQRQQKHAFTELLQSLAFAAEVGDRRLVTYFAAELRQRYAESLNR